MSSDTYGRTITYLRLSVTDRCNLRCVYCMPEEGVKPKTHEQILTLEEMALFVQEAAHMGITHIRLTGGEPLVRLGVPQLIADIKATPGIQDVSMTTNGVLLPTYAEELRQAGLDRVNISLDTLDAALYQKITRRDALSQTLHAIDVACEYGFEPVKINAVAVRSFGQDLYDLACLSIDRPIHVRFIEYMPMGTPLFETGTKDDTGEGIPSDELLQTISAQGIAQGRGPLNDVSKEHAPSGAGPARYYAFEGAQGTVGVISALSHHFCKTCNRLRLTADGKLRPCLFSDKEIDVRSALRKEDTEKVQALVRQALLVKPASHAFKRGTERKMSQIGG